MEKEFLSGITGGIIREGNSLFAYLRQPYQNAEKSLLERINKNGVISEEDIMVAAHNLLVHKYVKKIKNYNSILDKAERQFDAILASANDKEINLQIPDDEWLEFFFDLSSRVSSEAVQNVWARILLQEHMEKGYVKKAMLNILALLDADSARTFQNICSLTYRMSIEEDIRDIPFVIYDYNIDSLLKDYEGDKTCFEDYLNICPQEEELDYLSELGLITTTNLTESVYCVYFTEEANVTFSCINKEVTIVSPYNNESKMFQVESSFVLFTQMGYALYKILNIPVFYGLFDVVKRFAENQTNS